MSCLHHRRQIIWSLPLIVAALTWTAVGRGEEGDKFDGAVWKFELTEKKPPQKKLYGRFRISNQVVYQRDKPVDKQFSKQVGKNTPNGTKTKMEVSDFRVFADPDKKDVQFMEGTARLSMEKFGEWSGVFTDKAGVNWEMKCSRIEE